MSDDAPPPLPPFPPVMAAAGVAAAQAASAAAPTVPPSASPSSASSSSGVQFHHLPSHSASGLQPLVPPSPASSAAGVVSPSGPGVSSDAGVPLGGAAVPATPASKHSRKSTGTATEEEDTDSELESEEEFVHKNSDSEDDNAGVRGALASVPESGAAAASSSPPVTPAGDHAVIVAASSAAAGGVVVGSENPSSQVVKEGYLRKLGAKVKNWKNRYFKLVGYVLSYHESREQQLPVLGEIQLTGTLAKAEPDSLFGFPFTFSVHQSHAGQRTYYMVAESQADMDDWLRALRPRHSFSPQGLPLRLTPRVHIEQAMNPDDAALRAITVNSAPINSSYISTDANRKENSRSTLKGAVSKKKRRFVLDGYDLDLTYITNRIIAMGFPADGTEAVYRNAMPDVQRFLNERHPGHYRVYNLCSERKYSHDKFQYRVLDFPFDDHNNPAFEDVPYFCKDVADFLSAHEKNVAIIHCKAGKGRTGLLIVVFLLFCGEWQTASEALRYYAFARTQNQKGVTIASQIRWVFYFEKYLQLSRDGIGLPKLQALALRKMTFSKKYPQFDFFVSHCHGHTTTSKDKEAMTRVKETKNKEGGLEIEFLAPANGWASDPQHWVFAKDFQFEFFKGKLFGGGSRVMSFWLHTQFLSMEPGLRIKLERMDIDKVSKDKTCPEFSLELEFEPVHEGKWAAEAGAPHNVLSSSLVVTPPPHMPQLPASMPAEDRDMLTASLSMMLEGRKMNRFYLGNKANKEKEVEQKEVHVFLRKDDDSDRYSLYYCLDSQSLSNAGEQLGGNERIPLASLTGILVGKHAELWSRSVAARQTPEERCCTLQFQGGELHLEAYSARQLSLWLEGIKYLLSLHGGVREEQGEPFQQSLLSLTAGRSAAAVNGAGASEGSRERAETFAQPPPIKVPENRHRKIIKPEPKQ